MTDYTPAATGTGARARVQRFGAFLAGMVMPNLGAFIAFGLITALFIPDGWVNKIAGTQTDVSTQISSVVGPLIVILIPILIAFTGGFRVYGHRGGVVGAVALVGAMMAPVALPWLTGISLNGEEVTRPGSIAEIGPTILAAFVLGPLTAWLLKKWDNAIAGKVKGGFEMLVDNFAAGIIGGFMAVVGLYIIGPITFWISQGLGWLANALVNTGLLPAGVDRRRAGEGAVPQQRDQPRRVHAARRRSGRRSGQVDLLHDRIEPRPRPRHPDRHAAVRTARDPSDGSRRHGRPLPRRHPRDLLPVRAA